MDKEEIERDSKLNTKEDIAHGVEEMKQKLFENFDSSNDGLDT